MRAPLSSKRPRVETGGEGTSRPVDGVLSPDPVAGPVRADSAQQPVVAGDTHVLADAALVPLPAAEPVVLSSGDGSPGNASSVGWNRL